MKKQKIVWPQFVKNSKGKIINVYIPIEAYEKIQKDLKEWEKIQKEEGVKWVKLKTTKVTKKKSKKCLEKPVKKVCKK